GSDRCGEAPRSAQRTSRQRAGLRHGSSRGHRRREILSPFPPHPQLDVGLTQSRFQFLVLDLELQLTRTAPPSSLLQPLPASIQELLLPVMNRLFRHAVASCRLSHRVLPPQNGTAPLAASDRSSSSMASPSPLLRSGPQPRPEQETMTRGSIQWLFIHFEERSHALLVPFCLLWCLQAAVAQVTP